MFRANDEAEKKRIENEPYFLTGKHGSTYSKAKSIYENAEQEDRARHALNVIREACGPYIQSYPEWHPLLAHPGVKTHRTSPEIRHLDHTRFMVSGLITCPYGHGITELFQWVSDSYRFDKTSCINEPALSSWVYMSRHVGRINAAYITDDLIEYLEDSMGQGYFDGYTYKHEDGVIPEDVIHFYSKDAHPILIWIEWQERFMPLDDGTISPAAAIPLMMASSIGDIPAASVAEDWEHMRGNLLGDPHGKRSSLFVNQQTAKLLRQSFTALTESGAYGDSKY